MPLYEYQCDACGARFERIQKFSDPPVKECPKCNGHVHKLLSSPAFQFKGTGWYATDYAKSGEKKREGDSKDASTESKDAKPAAESSTSTKSATESKDSTSSGSSTPTTPAKS